MSYNDVETDPEYAMSMRRRMARIFAMRVAGDIYSEMYEDYNREELAEEDND